VSMGRYRPYGSSAWKDVRTAVLSLAPIVRNRRSDCADVNWRRLAPVRQALVHAAESMQADDLRHADVRIAHRPGETALAWLLGGWLAARLHWSDAAAPASEEGPQADDMVTLECAPATGNRTMSRMAEQVLVTGRDRTAV